MAEWYKHSIVEWQEETASLSHDEYRLLHVIRGRIMLNDGPIVAHKKMLAVSSGISSRAFDSTLQRLITKGHLRFDGELISSDWTERELNELATRRGVRQESGREGGRESGKSRRSQAERSPTPPMRDENANDNNGPSQVTLPVGGSREEERRGENRRGDQRTEDDRPDWERYEIVEGVVKLTEKTLDDWQKAYPSVNVRGECRSISEFANKRASEGANWFQVIQGRLGKLDRENNARRMEISARAEAEAKHKTAFRPSLV